MAIASAPALGTTRRRSLIGKLASALAARVHVRPASLTALLAVAREHVLTGAALASADFGAFHWGSGVGWVVTGVSLFLLDFAVTG